MKNLQWSESALASAAIALGAANTEPPLSAKETQVASSSTEVSGQSVETLRQQIQAGADPLGNLFCQTRCPGTRRQSGATYTPQPIVDAMLDWAKLYHPDISRIVDAGAGSGRFIKTSATAFPEAQLVAIENDPLASLLLRANLASSGLAHRSSILTSDYRTLSLPSFKGKTLFVGNPPYVRHHNIEPSWKSWLTEQSIGVGLQASQLAGLHIHFLLATLLKANDGDVGCLITSSEWLDVNYGQVARDMFLGRLGGKEIYLIEPQLAPFPDAATTAAIFSFEIGSRSESVSFRRIQQLEDLKLLPGHPVLRERLEHEHRWTFFTRESKPAPAGYLELGEVCRVHRGQVTGANNIWIESELSCGLPDNLMFPSVTKARELIVAGPTLNDPSLLRRVIDLPVDLDILSPEHRFLVDRFLTKARQKGAHEGYVARNRKAWWAVGLRKPAPILATYMARRPPVFVRNVAEAHHINIAHGLYPRQELSEVILAKLVGFLCRSADQNNGRTYAGGLTKFEPREMERLLIPHPDALAKL